MALILKGKVITELGIKSPATKFFNVYKNQIHNLPNIAENMHEGKVHQGDWHGIGSVKSWTFTTEGKVETLKTSREAIDEQNKLVTFKLFDGEISKNYKVFKTILQVTDKDGGGGVAIWTFDYEKLNEDVAPPYRYLEFVTGALTKDVDAHLLKAEQ